MEGKFGQTTHVHVNIYNYSNSLLMALKCMKITNETSNDCIAWNGMDRYCKETTQVPTLGVRN